MPDDLYVEVSRLVWSLPCCTARDTWIRRDGDAVIVEQAAHWGHNQLTETRLRQCYDVETTIAHTTRRAVMRVTTRRA